MWGFMPNRERGEKYGVKSEKEKGEIRDK